MKTGNFSLLQSYEIEFAEFPKTIQTFINESRFLNYFTSA